MNVFNLWGSLNLNATGFFNGLASAGEAISSFAGKAEVIIGTVKTIDGAIAGISDKVVSTTATFVSETVSIAKAIDENVMGVVEQAKGIVIGAFQSMATEGVAFFKDVLQEGMSFDTAMGQVGATLLQTREDMDTITVSVDGFNGTLREFAKKMGAETAFTATQAGEALNYMALAGYDAQTSAEMLPKVLNLAAAGAMDLGTASDMVTDSQTALGIEMQNMTDFIDQMAKTASSSNTSVSQLGDAILSIGATGRQVKGGFTELNTVLGVLADNGIKASESGHMLRRLLTNLTTAEGDAKEQLDKLGVSVYDAQDNLRDLPSIFLDLDNAMSRLTDKERTKAINDIFGQYSLAGANALLKTSAERWGTLTEKIKDSKGAAQAMADIQLETLPGQITILQSAFSGLKTELYENVAPMTKEFVKTLSEGLSSVTQEITNGNFAAAFTRLGSTAVKLIEDGVNTILENAATINEFIDGIVIFVDKVGTALFESGSKLLPQILGHLLYFSQQIITNLSDFLSSEENIKTIEDTVSHLFEQLKTFFNKNQDKLYNIFSTMVDLGIEFIDDLFVLKREIIYNILSEKVLEILDDLPGKVREWLESDGLKENVNNIIAFIGELLQVLLDSGASIALQVTDFIINIADKMMITLSDFLLDPENKEKIRFVIAYILTSIEEFLDRNEDIIYLIFSEYFDLAVGFAVKVWDLKRETTAKLIIRKFNEMFENDIGTNLIEGFFAAAFPAEDIFTKVLKVAGVIIEDFKKAFGIHSPSTVFRDEIGKMVIEGFWEGIDNATNWLIEQIGGFTDSVTNAFKDFFGIQSPSKLMRDEVGKFMAEGIGVGFTKEMDKVTEDMLKALPTTFDMDPIDIKSAEKVTTNQTKNETFIFKVENFYNQTDSDLERLAVQFRNFIVEEKVASL